MLYTLNDLLDRINRFSYYSYQPIVMRLYNCKTERWKYTSLHKCLCI